MLVDLTQGEKDEAGSWFGYWDHEPRFQGGRLNGLSRSRSGRVISPHCQGGLKSRAYADYVHNYIGFIVDGHVVRNPFPLKPRIEYLWGLAVGHPAEGLANIDEMNVFGSYTPHGIMVRRNSPNFEYQMHHVWDQAQYLAKSKSKVYYPYKSDAFK